MKHKKYIICSIIALLILIVGLMIIACSRKKEFNDNAVVELSTNGGVPYNWEYILEDESIAKLDKQDSKGPNDNTSGGKIQLKYYFVGKKEGNTTLTFNYKSITDETITETKVYSVIVDKNLKIKIEEID